MAALKRALLTHRCPEFCLVQWGHAYANIGGVLLIWGIRDITKDAYLPAVYSSSAKMKIFTGTKARAVRKQPPWGPRPIVRVDVGRSPQPQFLNVHYLSFPSVIEKGVWKGAFAHLRMCVLTATVSLGRISFLLRP